MCYGMLSSCARGFPGLAWLRRLECQVEDEVVDDDRRPRIGGLAGAASDFSPRAVERLERDGRLAGHHYLPAIKADLLSRLGRTGETAAAYRQALALAASDAERAFLDEQIAGQADRG